ncbi:hypothetical protein NP493_1532g01001 [Ridgeia piscesae]|uniref:Uncharacterized protein n=1 Tax=Ridgeia piscesae TaxID=27915 RepID=A0AAD9N9X1_RIDPI|nr:hypothetical protein NP493_1532g01001 [Ridgeia piscesae]
MSETPVGSALLYSRCSIWPSSASSCYSPSCPRRQREV